MQDTTQDTVHPTVQDTLMRQVLGIWLLLGESRRGVGVRRRDQRGDVPGWVLVTVMTAGLVMAIWGVASSQLQSMLTTALNSVK